MLGEIVVLCYFRVCSSLLSCGFDQQRLVEERVYVNLHFRSQSIFERSQDRNSSRSSGGVMLTTPFGSCLTDFLTWPRPACLGMVLPTVGGALSHRSLTKGQSDGGNSPVEALLPQWTLCCQVCNNITSTGLDDKKSLHMFSKMK